MSIVVLAFAADAGRSRRSGSRTGGRAPGRAVVAKCDGSSPQYGHPFFRAQVMTSRWRKFHALIVVVAISLASACSPTRPPLEQLDAASRALSAARAADAQTYAAADYRSAGAHYDAAQAAEARKDYDAAAQLAAESQVDSELATAKSRLAKTRAAVDKLRQDNADLARDLGTATEAQP